MSCYCQCQRDYHDNDIFRNRLISIAAWTDYAVLMHVAHALSGVKKNIYLSDYVTTTTVENHTYGSYELQCATVFSRYLRIKYPTIRRHRYFWSIVRTTVLSSACHYNYIRFYFIFAQFKILCLRCHNMILYYVILWRHRFFFTLFIFIHQRNVLYAAVRRARSALS